MKKFRKRRLCNRNSSEQDYFVFQHKVKEKKRETKSVTVADERMIKQEMSEWKRQKEKTGMMAMNEETQDEKKH